MDSNKLYTYDRLSDFVKNYKEYVTRVEEDAKNQVDDPYKYYHFEESPNGVTSRNLGNLNRESLSSISDWKALPIKNGIDAWRMNLAKMYNRYKEKEFTNTLTNREDGLKYILNTSNDPQLFTQPINILDTDNTNLSYNASIENTASKSGNISDINTFLASNLSDLTSDIIVEETKMISLDITGLVYVENGSYEFTIENAGCTVHIWIGNHSICEFTSKNSTLNNNTSTYQTHYNINQHVPIRIQCFFTSDLLGKENTFATLKFNLTMKHNGSVIDKLPFFTNVKPPLLLYCAFVTENKNDLIDDNFLCYSRFTIEDNEIVVNNHDDLHRFYSSIREKLVDIVDGKYDYNQFNRISYGDIPNINIKYTQFFSSNEPPFSYYLCILNSDSRMGKTFQIKDDKDNESDIYEMSKFSDDLSNSILEYSDNYHEKTGYYPNRSSVDNDYLTNVYDITGTQCKEECNSNIDCNHYFTYTSNKNPKCVTGTTMPYYNRVVPKNSEHPIDKNSSTLHVRNYKLDIGSDANCSGIKLNQNKFIQNTYDYSDDFKYSKYAMAENDIVTPKRLGDCGSIEYIKQENDAKKILYEDARYFQNGEFKETFQGQGPAQESIEHRFKDTHAISDTRDVIRGNLKNSAKYSDKMMNIHKQHELLNDKIPKMNNLYNYMRDDPKYDHKGDELLHFRTKLQADIRKKKVMDNNELNDNTKLLLALGTVTSVTMIVFAIMLARD